MRVWILCFILVELLGICRGNEGPKVKVSLGEIKGHFKFSENGKKFEAFEGIPYAKPPVGELRFKPPEKKEPWTSELLATKYSPFCVQYEMNDSSEDCLYLNVYRPLKEGMDDSKKLPVILWIHGGYYMFGSGKLYGPEYLMDRNLIFVTINYRLGPFGFLSTEDDVVPGNMGLKDQNMAIRWVSENIEKFGGDPKQITLVGLSAGGASVHYHYLSPMSAGLFKGGISLSGNALLPWVQAGGSAEKAKKMGALLDCPTNNNLEMIQCLRSKPAHSISQAIKHFFVRHYAPTTPFGPVIEKSADNYFINRHPAEIIKSGDAQDLPWLTGVVSEEGIYPAAEFIADDERLKYVDENWNKLAPHLLDFNYTVPVEKHEEVAQTIRRHYFGTKSIDRSTVGQFVKALGDRTFVIDAEKAARMQAKVNKSPVWFFYFSYRGAHSLSEVATRTNVNYGVCHGDDALYVVKFVGVNTTSTENDREMQKDLLDLWTTFADKGKPNLNVEWPPVDATKKPELNYLHIFGPKQFQMEANSDLGEKTFWNGLNLNP